MWIDSQAYNRCRLTEVSPIASRWSHSTAPRVRVSGFERHNLGSSVRIYLDESSGRRNHARTGGTLGLRKA